MCPFCAYGSHQGMLVCLHIYRQCYLERKNQPIMYYIFLQCALNCLNNLEHKDINTDGLAVLFLFGMIRMSSAAVWFSHTWSSLDGLSTWAKTRLSVSGFVGTYGIFGSDGGCSHTLKVSAFPKEPVKCPIWVCLFFLQSKVMQAYFKPFVKRVHAMPANFAAKVMRNTCYFSSSGSAVGTVNPRRWLK